MITYIHIIYPSSLCFTQQTSCINMRSLFQTVVKPSTRPMVLGNQKHIVKSSCQKLKKKKKKKREKIKLSE